MVVSLSLDGNLYLSLSVLLFFAFYGFSALQLLYRAVTDQIVVIRGHCTGLGKNSDAPPYQNALSVVRPTYSENTDIRKTSKC